MITYYVGREALALGLEENEKENCRAIVTECLEANGIAPWKRIETELFVFPGNILLIARPAAPYIVRGSAAGPRLVRKGQERA